MNTSHKIFMAAGLFALLSSSALAQSSGVKWQNGNVLTAQQMQRLDNAKMNVDSLGKPGFAPKLNALGQITDPVVGDVSGATANAAGDTVSSISDTAKSAQTTAKGAVQSNGGDASKTVVTPTGDTASHSLSDVAAQATGSVQKTSIGAANGVAPLDANARMSADISGSIENGTVSGANPRTFASRKKDLPDLNDYVPTWDGSTTFQTNLAAYFNSGTRYVAPLPCNSAVPLPDKNGYVDVGGISGKMFIDLCGVQRVGGGYYNYVDYAIGNNNPTITSYGGQVFFNRYNSGAVNSVGHVSFNVTQATANPVTQWPGGIDPDMPNVTVRSRQNEYGPDGKTATTGSALAFTAKTDNFSHRNWEVQAQGEKIFCVNHRIGGSCWGYSTNINDISGRSAQPWNLINENDSQSNGPENPAAFYNPKLSYRQMDYASAVALVPSGWAASTSYSADKDDPDKIVVTDAGGVQRILIVSASGTSGTTEPTIASDAAEGSTITDGTVTWTVGTTLDTTIGVVHWINRDGGGSPSSHASYNFGFSGNAQMNNSMFDASHALLGPKAAAYRMAPDQAFSLCDSPNATSDSDINQCVLSYKLFYGQLTYAAYGKQIFIAGNDGLFYVPNKLQGGTVVALGSLYLGKMSKSEILAIKSPSEGQKVFNTDDHTEEVYRCPTTTTCGWYAPQYSATPLSN